METVAIGMKGWFTQLVLGVPWLCKEGAADLITTKKEEVSGHLAEPGAAHALVQPLRSFPLQDVPNHRPGGAMREPPVTTIARRPHPHIPMRTRYVFSHPRRSHLQAYTHSNNPVKAQSLTCHRPERSSPPSSSRAGPAYGTSPAQWGTAQARRTQKPRTPQLHSAGHWNRQKPRLRHTKIQTEKLRETLTRRNWDTQRLGHTETEAHGDTDRDAQRSRHTETHWDWGTQKYTKAQGSKILL